MREVSTRALRGLLEGAHGLGVPPGEVTQGLWTDEVSPSSWVEWSTFAEMLQRVEDRVGPDGMIAIGQSIRSTAPFRPIRQLARLVVDPADLYRLGYRWFGLALFPQCSCSCEQLDDCLFEQRIELSLQSVDSPAFLRVMLGALQVAPVLLGWPTSVVEMDLQERSAVYRIALPENRSLVAHLRGWWRRRPEDGETLSELAQRAESLSAEIKMREKSEEQLAADGHSLEVAAEQRSRLETELRDSRDQLEYRVAERTAALMRDNIRLRQLIKGEAESAQSPNDSHERGQGPKPAPTVR